MQYAFWALIGWCGTPWPRRWPWPPPPPPNGDPWLVKGLNVVGAVAGGWAFEQLWPMGPTATGIGVAASAVGAYVGSVLIGDVAGLIRGGKKA